MYIVVGIKMGIIDQCSIVNLINYLKYHKSAFYPLWKIIAFNTNNYSAFYLR